MRAASRLSAAAIAATFAFTAPVHAQITFAGFTNGCFYTAGSPACSPATTNAPRTSTSGPLSYINSTFNVTTVNGTAAIGNMAASTGGAPNVDNLGSITFPGGPVSFTDFVNQRFVMNVSFTAPSGVNNTNNVWTAVLTGSVSQTAGGVSLDFDNAPRQFTYNGGTFTFRIDDVSLTKNSNPTSIGLSGFIIASQTTVPEPGTWALMASGLVGVAMVARRRQRG